MITIGGNPFVENTPCMMRKQPVLVFEQSWYAATVITILEIEKHCILPDLALYNVFTTAYL